MNMKKDVVIVGGGPAGIITALTTKEVYPQKTVLVAKGRVSMERRFSLDDKRTASVSTYIARGGQRRDVLGCWCALVGDQQHQMCSAFCDKPTTVVSMPCTELRQLLVDDSRMGMKVLEKLVLSLRERIEFSYGVMENL